MKKIVVAGICVLLATSLGSAVFGQDRGTAKTTVNGKTVEIEYGRPALQGRDMLSKLPVGNTWRMGMNAATTLKTEVALTANKKVIKPGEYTLTAKRVQEDKWQLIVSGDNGTVQLPLANRKVKSSVEQFTISLKTQKENRVNFLMTWGQLAVGKIFDVE